MGFIDCQKETGCVPSEALRWNLTTHICRLMARICNPPTFMKQLAAES